MRVGGPLLVCSNHSENAQRPNNHVCTTHESCTVKFAATVVTTLVAGSVVSLQALLLAAETAMGRSREAVRDQTIQS